MNWLREWNANQLLFISYSDLFDSSDPKLRDTNISNSIKLKLIRTMLAQLMSSDLHLSATIGKAMQQFIIFIIL